MTLWLILKVKYATVKWILMLVHCTVITQLCRDDFEQRLGYVIWLYTIIKFMIETI